MLEEWMEQYLKKLIVEWYERSGGTIREFTPFDRFICLWISFNAWGSHESGRETDRAMIEWAKNNDLLNRAFNGLATEQNFNFTLEKLRRMCPIPRHRKWNGSDRVTIDDPRKWGEVLEVIYVIRCNLFHGRKSLQNIPDVQLVDLAYEILSKVFESVITPLKQ
jgi:hypothetical protein